MNAKVVAFTANKGGIGKSTLCLNYAYWRAMKGSRVLIIDLDYQRDISLMFPNADKKAVRDAHIYRAFQHDADDVSKPFPKDFRPAHVDKNIDLFSGSTELDHVDELMSAKPNLATSVLLNVFVTFKLVDKYDYILLDCHNSFGTATVNGLICCDYILSPTIPNFFSINAVGDMMQKLTNLKHTYYNVRARQSDIHAKLYFIGSMIHFNTKSSHQFLDAIKDDPHFIASFHYRELVNKANNSRESIFQYADNSHDKDIVLDEIEPEFKKIDNIIGGSQK